MILPLPQVESQGNFLAVKRAGDSFGELALLSKERVRRTAGGGPRRRFATVACAVAGE